jgi:hypothetical protein
MYVFPFAHNMKVTNDRPSNTGISQIGWATPMTNLAISLHDD